MKTISQLLTSVIILIVFISLAYVAPQWPLWITIVVFTLVLVIATAIMTGITLALTKREHRNEE